MVTKMEVIFSFLTSLVMIVAMTTGSTNAWKLRKRLILVKPKVPHTRRDIQSYGLKALEEFNALEQRTTLGNTRSLHSTPVCQYTICPTGTRCVPKESQCEARQCPVYAVCERVRELLDICRQPVETGNCDLDQDMWYFNSTSHQCQRFTYTGCGGNQNQFGTQTLCSSTCVRNQQICHLKAEKGPCRASMIKFYYDAIRHRCRSFVYGGCDGNVNNFEHFEYCMNSCRGI